MLRNLLAATFLWLSEAAFAQPVPVPVEDQICSDRPTKADFACVVPQGVFQLESDLYNWTNKGNELFTNPTLKYGMGHNIDIEINIAPYVFNQTTHKWGNGDLYLQTKWNFYNSPDSTFQAAMLPYIKVPTASNGIGNGFVEGGVLFPLTYTIAGFTIAPTPEIDQFHNVVGTGYYTSLQLPIGVSHTLISDNLTMFVEIWNQIPLANAVNLGRLGHLQQSADIGFGYLITPRLQWDIGANFGLTSSTPKQQVYTGISVKF